MKGRAKAGPRRQEAGLNVLIVLMGVSAGIAFDAAISHVLIGLSRRPRDATRLAFAATAVAAGVGSLAVLAMYGGDSPATHAAITKWLFVPANVVFIVSAAWLVALFSGVRPRPWLWALVAGGAVVLVADAVLPYGLLHRTLGDLREVWIGGAHVMDMSASDPHPLYLLVDLLSLSAFVFMYYALARLLKRGERSKAAYLAIAVLIFSASTLLDTLTDHGIVSTLYVTQLFFVGVVLTMSFALRREALLGEQELEAYRTRLESLVEARVHELDEANEQLALQVGERLAAEETLRERVAQLGALQHFAQTLVQRTALEDALRQACDELVVLFRADSVCVHLAAGPAGDLLDVARPGHLLTAPAGDLSAAPSGRATGTAVDSLAVDAVPAFRQALEARTPLVFQGVSTLDAQEAKGADHLPDRIREAHDVLVAPMATRTDVIGVLTVGREGRGGRPFADADLLVARTAADTLAAAVENEVLHRQETRQAAAAERQRLARDLHDSVTQSIYSASLIAEALPAVWDRQPEEGLANLARLRRLVRAALAEMRTLLYELRPASLEAASLQTLVERLGDALAGQIQAPVEVSVSEEDYLPPDVKLALYRVIQEAFSNIAKHARASHAAAVVLVHPGGVAVTVTDDGRGFDPDDVTPDHMGLRIMRERMDKIGAELLLRSAPGRGTSITVGWRRPPATTDVRASSRAEADPARIDDTAAARTILDPPHGIRG